MPFCESLEVGSKRYKVQGADSDSERRLGLPSKGAWVEETMLGPPASSASREAPGLCRGGRQHLGEVFRRLAMKESRVEEANSMAALSGQTPKAAGFAGGILISITALYALVG